MDNYIIVNADAIQKRIEGLKKPIAHFDGIHVSNEQNARIDELEELLSNSIPLIPEIEKAFIQGSHFKEKWVKEIHLIDSDIILQEPNKEKYVSQLKFDI